MFASAELGNKTSKTDYEERLPQLRVDLVNAQYDLMREGDFPVLVLISGDHQLGCRETLRGMHEWMDGRYIQTHVPAAASSEMAGRPALWRYWCRLPRRGYIGAFLNGWVTPPINEMVVGKGDESIFANQIERIGSFEGTLVADGALLIKLWLHIPKSEYKKLIQRLRKKEQDWRLVEEDYLTFEKHDEVVEAAERLIEKTSTGDAPWHVVESTDGRYAGLEIGRILHESIARRLESRTPAPVDPASPAPSSEGKSVLEAVDLTESVEKDVYRKRLEKLQGDLRGLTDEAARRGISSVLAFEGWDAAGKGGVIRRLTAAVDVRDFRVLPIAAPTQEEKLYHYLWRFWKELPAPGKTVIFDRTWYGRVLVERVEGFAREDEWRRAYQEIRDFEEQLLEAGSVVLKFWLHIHPDEQLRRFEARQQTPFKKYKITEEDMRNRDRWGDYELAVDEMVKRTSTSESPWHLVPAVDKRSARLRVLEIYKQALAERLGNRKAKKK